MDKVAGYGPSPLSSFGKVNQTFKIGGGGRTPAYSPISVF